MISAAQLAAVMPRADPGRWIAPLNRAMAEYSIDANDGRASMFLAQVAAETTGLTVLEENLNYSVARLIAVWPKRFDLRNASLYAGRPDALADLVYANRNGNRDEQSGDGWLFRGRGGLMLTGRANYSAAGFSLGSPGIISDPDQVATDPLTAMRAGAWYWAQSGCNQFADAGDFDRVTDAINKYTDSRARRVALWQTAQGALA